MSWVHFTKRWKTNWPERLDSREHQNWTRVGSHNELPARWAWSGNQNWNWTETILTRGLEFLIDWTSWSQTWSTKSTTTTSRKTSETKMEVFAFASRSKAKAKPRRPSTTCSSSRTVPILERTWIDIEPGAQFDQAYPVAKRLNTLLRHGELPRVEDGAIEFWRLKDDLRNKFEYSQYWSDDVWKSKMAGGGGNNKRFQYCTDLSGQEILYLRALQGHSGRNPTDSYTAGQCLDSEQFLRAHSSYWMCSQFTLHHKFRIDSGRTNF